MENEIIKPVIIENNTILLSSYLNEQSFAKTDLGRSINENGILAEVSSDLKEIKLNLWNFTDTKIINNTVFYSCEGDFDSTLLEDFSEENSAFTLAAIKKLIDNKEFSEKNQITLPGAEGILIKKSQNTSENVKILFLPGKIFDRCLSNSHFYGKVQGLFINKALTDIEAKIFLQGVIAYKAISNEMPFTQENLSKRQEDFFDGNFIPLEYLVKNIDKNIAGFVNSSLKIKAKKRIIPGEKRFVDQKFENSRKELLDSSLKFAPSMVLKENYIYKDEKSSLSDEEFSLNRKKFQKKQKIELNCRRFLKRNSNQIFGGIVALIILISGCYSFTKQNGKLATSMGLTSFETVQTLYTAIHKADATIIKEIAKGKNVKSLDQKVSGFYVTNKQREVFNEKDGTFTPGQWLFFKGESDFWQYGVTNLSIDGINVNPNFKYPVRNDKKAPLISENGVQLKKGDKTSHKVKYNLVHYDGESIINVNPAEEEVFLEWNGKRWIVKDLKGKARTNSYRVKDYKADYLKALEMSSGDIKIACDILREKYDFVPREDELLSETEFLIEKYNSSSAKEFLEKHTK